MACAAETLFNQQDRRCALRVLVGDDQPDVREALRLLFKGAGHKTETVDSPRALLSAAREGEYDAILVDLNYTRDTTSGDEGLDLLESLKAAGNAAPVIAMTAWGSVDLAVEAMRRGAAGFVQKPWDNERLLSTVADRAQEAAAERTRTRRVEADLEVARGIQQRLFPRGGKALRTLCYAGHCEPAHEVGGDFYDTLDLGRGRMGFVLGDVAGKGVAAALLMANLQALLRSHVWPGLDDPGPMLGQVNRLFYESTPMERYATLFFGVYDEARRTLTYVNCGHNAPLLARADGRIERLDATATGIGLFPTWKYEQRTVALDPGDTLVLYSDGVVEAGGDAGEEFGVSRLEEMVLTARRGNVDALAEWIVRAVRAWSPSGLSDDATVLALRAC